MGGPMNSVTETLRLRGVIISRTLVLPGSYSTKLDQPSPAQYDLYSILVHELGHAVAESIDLAGDLEPWDVGFDHARAVKSELELASVRVYLSVNGVAVLEQQGGHPIMDPLGPAVALVNLMREAGGGRTGQFVTTGSCTGLRYLKPGDSCTVRFDALGTATVTFTR